MVISQRVVVAPISRLIIGVVLMCLFGVEPVVAESEKPEFDLQTLLDPDTKTGSQFLKGFVAIECAAIASRIDDAEERRLLRAGYEALLLAIRPLLEKKPESGKDGWDFDSVEEIVSFLAGRQFGASYEQHRQKWMQSPEDDLERFYRAKFHERNCGVIGR